MQQLYVIQDMGERGNFLKLYVYSTLSKFQSIFPSSFLLFISLRDSGYDEDIVNWKLDDLCCCSLKYLDKIILKTSFVMN